MKTKMLGIRPYKAEDAKEIISWCRDEITFYRWTAGKLGGFPVAESEFKFVETLMPFVAFNENGTVGFFTLRKPDGTTDELRFGFVIVNPDIRGKGYGKEMIRLGLKYAFELYGAEKVSIGVFENNLPAYHCYKSIGFSELDFTDKYSVLGEEWVCIELMMKKERWFNL